DARLISIPLASKAAKNKAPCGALDSKRKKNYN
ncbi:MAG: hypothetical protein ACI9AT_000537, partial [Ulvibacter sp.]